MFQRRRQRERGGAGTFSLIYLCCGQNDNLERALSAANFIMPNINKIRPRRLFRPDRARLLPKSQWGAAHKGRQRVTVVSFSSKHLERQIGVKQMNGGVLRLRFMRWCWHLLREKPKHCSLLHVCNQRVYTKGKVLSSFKQVRLEPLACVGLAVF